MDDVDEKNIENLTEQEIKFNQAVERMLKGYDEGLRLSFGEHVHKPFGFNKDDKNPLGDTFAKDLLMTVLAPIALAITTSIQLIQSLVVLVLLPLMDSHDRNDVAKEIGIQTLFQLSLIVTAVISPLARLYNTATRAYASLNKESYDFVDEKTIVEVKEKLVDGIKELITIKPHEQMKERMSDLRGEGGHEGDNKGPKLS